MSWIDRVQTPDDLKALRPDEVVAYCDALRSFLVDTVSHTGGHLGSNLGVVELTVALHRVFDFRHDRLVLDTSHQSYPHKVLTSRRSYFDTLRQTDGLSGFMDRAESPYDTFTMGHAGTAVSVAAGLARADRLRGIDDRRIVAIVGDAAAGTGVTFEALNDAGHRDDRLLVILNDNAWSIARTVGGMRKYLDRIRTLPAYREGKVELLEALEAVPLVGDRLSRWAGSVKEAFANSVSPGHLFRELGWTYFGPENGHDVVQLERLLLDLQRVEGPVLLHVVTEKGRGAPEPGDDAAHAVAAAPKLEIAPRPKVPGVRFQDAFGRAVAAAMDDDPRVVALTAAMPDGTGLAPVGRAHPERVIDVGICEPHAVAMAAGLADAGLRPVVAIYSTFLQRAYDQVWQEVAVQGVPVVFALDRAGIVGGDGVTHQGLFDIAYLRTLPGITLMAPADPPELERMLAFALRRSDPCALRYPRGAAPDASLPGNETPLRLGEGQLLRPGDDVALLAYGHVVAPALAAAEMLAGRGIEAAVWNARFARPLDHKAIERFVRRWPLVFTLEEHSVHGGFGSAVLELVHGLDVAPAATVRLIGVPDRLVPHGDPDAWRARFGLDAAGLVDRVQRELARMARAAGQAPRIAPADAHDLL